MSPAKSIPVLPYPAPFFLPSQGNLFTQWLGNSFNVSPIVGRTLDDSFANAWQIFIWNGRFGPIPTLSEAPLPPVWGYTDIQWSNWWAAFMYAHNNPRIVQILFCADLNTVKIGFNYSERTCQWTETFIWLFILLLHQNYIYFNVCSKIDHASYFFT